jgi:hypothetical protein
MAMVLARLTEEVRFFRLAVSKWRSGTEASTMIVDQKGQLLIWAINIWDKSTSFDASLGRDHGSLGCDLGLWVWVVMTMRVWERD